MANSKHLITALLVIMLAFPSALAVSRTVETAAVARIVGNSPQELIDQLQQDEINLAHASYYSDWYLPTDLDKSDYFNNVVFTSQYQFYDRLDPWLVNLANFAEETKDEWERSEFLIIEDHFSYAYDDGIYGSFDPGEAPWINDLDYYQPVFIHDADYAGISLPKVSTYTSDFAHNSMYIAPTAQKSKQFVMAMMCALANEDTAGEAFTAAREGYYYLVDDPEWLWYDDYVGLTLLSYSLFGDPTVEISTPSVDYDEWERVCSDYSVLEVDKDIYKAPASIQSMSAPSKRLDIIPFTKEVSISIEDYFIEEVSSEESDFELLVIPGTKTLLESYHPIFPIISQKDNFPERTVIVDHELVSFGNPVTIALDYPDWEEGYAQRLCNSSNITAQASYTVKGDQQQEVNTLINPITVLDCEQGEIKLYQDIVYTISYFPYSPIFISDVQAPRIVAPRETATIAVDLEAVTDEAVEGSVQLILDGQIIASRELANELSYNLEFLTPAAGSYTYEVQYLRNDEVLSKAQVNLIVESISFDLDIPGVNIDAETEIVLSAETSAEVELSIDSFLLKDDVLIQSRQDIVNISGNTEIPLTFTDLDREDQAYELIVYVRYQDTEELLGGQIITNNYPYISPIPVLRIPEGGAGYLDIAAWDVDDDELEITYSGDDNDDYFEAGPGSAGEYVVIVTANDGYVSSSQEARIIVYDLNEAPAIISQAPTESPVGVRYEYFVETNDPDEDDVMIELEAGPDGMIVEDSTIVWEPTVDGLYAVHIVASDGLLEDEQSYVLNVSGEIMCFEDEDCGTNSNVGDLYCEELDILQDFESFTCVNPGTLESYCDSDIEGLVQSTCIYDCIDASCYSPSISISDIETDPEYPLEGENFYLFFTLNNNEDYAVEGVLWRVNTSIDLFNSFLPIIIPAQESVQTSLTWAYEDSGTYNILVSAFVDPIEEEGLSAPVDQESHSLIIRAPKPPPDIPDIQRERDVMLNE